MSLLPKSESAAAAASLEDRIDLVCDAFEQEWRDGRRPSIAAYLQQVPQSERAALFSELLLVDLEFRSRAGDPAGKQNYLTSFPEFAGQIETLDFKYGLDDTHIAEPLAHITPETSRRRVAHFELLERIGKGAFGEVWKARDEKLQRTVAVKIPLQAELTEPELDRFLRESKASAQLRHPGIVSIYEVGRDRSTPYIVSAYVPGGNLRNLLDRSRPTPREAAELCRQLAEAIHHAHEQKVVHRDLKPTNVLLDENGQPHIADFGLAKWTDDGRERTLDGQLLGTPAYMSPEQARGEGNRADRRSDVYALGVLLYEMLTGQCPFQGDHASIVHQVVHEEPQPPRALDRSIPCDLETICLKAMAKDRDRRYPSAQELAVDLARYLRGDAILARRIGPLEKSWRIIRRRPAIAVATGLAGVALGLLWMINGLANENRGLIGYQTVNITTVPAGARLTFVPLDDKTGEPMPEKLVRASKRSPVVQELAAGDYLVVAVLDDGRFHEVFRHVPRDSSDLTEAYSHRHWRKSEHSLVLDDIKIPEQVPTQDMVLFQNSKHMNLDGRSERVQAPFYMDRFELTVKNHAAAKPGVAISEKRLGSIQPEDPVTISFDRAMAFAELLGKRLPSEREYEIAVSYCVPVRESVDSSGEEKTARFGPVGTPAEDRTATVPSVVGLRSNVAEWTTSRDLTINGLRAEMIPGEFRIVRGGNLSVINKDNAAIFRKSEIRKTDERMSVPRYNSLLNIGFRLVRSAQPRFVD